MRGGLFITWVTCTTLKANISAAWDRTIPDTSRWRSGSASCKQSHTTSKYLFHLLTKLNLSVIYPIILYSYRTYCNHFRSKVRFSIVSNHSYFKYSFWVFELKLIKARLIELDHYYSLSISIHYFSMNRVINMFVVTLLIITVIL